jgi:hypothetical protein
MKENPTVFPQDRDDDSSPTNIRREGGLTLLDYLAAKIVPEVIRANMEKSTKEGQEPNIQPFSVGMISYQIADGILEARQQFLTGPLVPDEVLPGPKLILPE